MDSIRISAFSIPTRAPETDGTLTWDHTVLVTVEVAAGGCVGLGYTYADAATAHLIHDTLAPLVLTLDPMSVSAGFAAMQRAVRNLGQRGVAAMAISAVDIACWDLKAKLLGASLVDLLGALRDCTPAYGSGGFINQTRAQLEEDLRAWRELGMHAVKIKIGNEPNRIDRVRAARAAIGSDVQLFVDANGAYEAKQAVRVAESFAPHDVAWFEEPVSSDDLEGLAFVRAHVAADVAAGEYGYEARDLDRMLAAGAVDVLQADITRVGGITGFMQVAALCDARGVRLSAHCAPALHAHVGCASPRLVHVEYFYDHQRIEQRFFRGLPVVRDGALWPDRAQPGMGLSLEREAASAHSVFDRELSSRHTAQRSAR